MAVTLPAITAKMGTRNYYITKMTAQELSGQVSVASELADWNELTLNELYQRKLNEKRVEQEIAPYLGNSADRFFGSIIVWVLSDEVLSFESVSTQVSIIPRAYQHAASSIGFLVIEGVVPGQEAGLVALDGQHRLAALRRVVQGHVSGPHAAAVRSDEIAVIFVQDEDVRSARDLFTVLNRSARRVSKNDVLIMSESDGAAMTARNLTSSSLLAPRGLLNDPLVKWEKNTIAQRDTQITTLNAVAEIAKIVASHLKVDIQDDDEGNPPGIVNLDRVEKEAFRWLETLFELSPEFAEMRREPNDVVAMRREGRYSLLMRPVGLQAFFHAVATLLDADAGGMTDLNEAVNGLLGLEWDIKGNLWRGILVVARGNLARKEQEWKLAGKLAAWLVAGSGSSPQFQSALLEDYRRQMGASNLSLPKPKGGN